MEHKRPADTLPEQIRQSSFNAGCGDHGENLCKACRNKKKVSPHVFRHTFATELVRNGADITAVQKMLGHSTLSITHIYTRVAGVEVKRTHREHHPREKDNPVKEEITPNIGMIRYHYNYKNSDE